MPLYVQSPIGCGGQTRIVAIGSAFPLQSGPGAVEAGGVVVERMLLPINQHPACESLMELLTCFFVLFFVFLRILPALLEDLHFFAGVCLNGFYNVLVLVLVYAQDCALRSGLI